MVFFYAFLYLPIGNAQINIKTGLQESASEEINHSTIILQAFYLSSFHKVRYLYKTVCTNASILLLFGHDQEAAVCCVILSCSNTSMLALLTRRANSTITVLPLKMFFVAHWTHAVCTRVPIKSATSGTQHRHLATVSFLSHFPFFYKPEIDIYNPVFRDLRKLLFYSWHSKIWSFP